MKGLSYFIILLVALSSLATQAQNHEIDLNTGYGSTMVDDMEFVWPFQKGDEHAHVYRIGFSYYFHPKKAVFLVKSGLNYDLKWRNDSRLNYLQIPLGIDFRLGGKVQWIFGGGLFGRLLVSSHGIYNPDFQNTKKSLQLGWYANTGIAYALSENYHLNLKYQYQADISKMYDGQRHSPGGATYALDVKSCDGLLVLGIRYQF